MKHFLCNIFVVVGTVIALAGCGNADKANQQQAYELVNQCSLLVVQLLDRVSELDSLILSETIDASKNKILQEFDSNNPYYVGAKAYCDNALTYVEGSIEGRFLLLGAGGQRFHALATVKDGDEFEWRKEYVQDVFVALEELRNSSKSLQAGLSESLNATALPKEMRIAIYSGLKLIERPFSYGVEMFIRKAEKSYQAALDRYQFLFEKQDQYSLKDGKLIFTNASDLSAYRLLIENEKKLERQLDRARKEISRW